MPANEVQWAMFLFFAVGALGGIVYLAQLMLELVSAAQVARDKAKLK